MVNNLARGGVLLVVSNVVVHHDDDPIIRNPVSVDDLVCVADVSLVTVVEPPVTPGHQQHPQISVLQRKLSKYGNSGQNPTSGISGRSLTDNAVLVWRMERREVSNTNS